MQRSYDYNGVTLDVSVEACFSVQSDRRIPTRATYVSVVRIFKAGAAVAIFSPLRFGELGGRPFATETEALMGGYSAARKMVDDLFT